jgi:electron transfer flavoprotein beta subunit
MKAKRKKVHSKKAADLGLSADDISATVEVTSYGPPPARPAGRILQGDLADQVRELVTALREEAKVI